MTKTNAGFLFAFGAALALSSSFVFSKSVFEDQVSMLQFGALWFSLGVAWNLVWYIARRSYRQLGIHTKQRILVAILVALLEGIATALFYMAIQAMENPAVVSFIGNIGPVFVTLLGVYLLKERFGSRQIVGIVITIVGVFMINYKDGAFVGFTDPGAVYVILASFLFSLATISGRRFKEYLDPDLMSLIRTFLLAMVFVILLLNSGERIDFETHTWRDIALGSLFETLLTIVFAYEALRRIKATSTSLVISTKGVWTLLLAWAFLDVFPGNLELIGGIITLAGIYLITMYRTEK